MLSKKLKECKQREHTRSEIILATETIEKES